MPYPTTRAYLARIACAPPYALRRGGLGCEAVLFLGFVGDVGGGHAY